jgi:mRNA interferase MazF
MGVVIKQYEIYLINLDPAQGLEIKKTRPCLILSPDEMNHTIGTIIIAPMTTKSHDYPTRIPINFENKDSWIVLDQISTVDKTRLVKKLGILKKEQIIQVKKIIKEMLVD